MLHYTHTHTLTLTVYLMLLVTSQSLLSAHPPPPRAQHSITRAIISTHDLPILYITYTSPTHPVGPSVIRPPLPSAISALGLPMFTSAHPSFLHLPSVTSTSTIMTVSLPVSMPSSAMGLPATKTHLTPFPGTPPLPPRIVEKILSREYFDLADLLPEQLHSSTTPTNNSLVILPESAYSTQRRKRRQIADIATWVQVYSTYMLVLASTFPDQLPELIAYQLLIVQHSRRLNTHHGYVTTSNSGSGPP